MLSSVRLVRPSADYRDEYIDFYEDWIGSGDNIVPWVVKKEPYDFEYTEEDGNIVRRFWIHQGHLSGK